MVRKMVRRKRKLKRKYKRNYQRGGFWTKEAKKWNRDANKWLNKKCKRLGGTAFSTNTPEWYKTKKRGWQGWDGTFRNKKQKGGTAEPPRYGYTNKKGWRGWGNYLYAPKNIM